MTSKESCGYLAISRRNLLKAGAFTGTGIAIGSLMPKRVVSAAPGKSPGRFKFIHYTDVHVLPEFSGARGYAQAIHFMNQHGVDFAISGGDLVYDVLRADSRRNRILWDLYTSLGKAFEMPVYEVIGNHDYFALSNREIASTEPGYGKQSFLERLGLESTYYSFDHKGWHFIVLDSISPIDGGWEPVIDDQQMEWLKVDLESNNSKPGIVALHVPVVTFFDQMAQGPLAAADRWNIMNDAKQLRELFEANNIRLVLQGHAHLREQFEYNGIHYISSGAVCGSWWTGSYYGHPEGYATVEVSGESFTWQYHTYGWVAKTSSAQNDTGLDVFTTVT